MGAMRFFFLLGGLTNRRWTGFFVKFSKSKCKISKQHLSNIYAIFSALSLDSSYRVRYNVATEREAHKKQRYSFTDGYGNKALKQLDAVWMHTDR